MTAAAARYGLEYKEFDWLAPIYLPLDHFMIKTLMKVYRQYSGDTVTEPVASGGATYAARHPQLRGVRRIDPWMSSSPNTSPTSGQCSANLFKAMEIYAHAVYELTQLNRIVTRRGSNNMFRRGGGLARPGGMIKPMAAPASRSLQAGPQTPAGVNRYIMRQRMFALGQDFNINNAAGQPCFKIDGKVRLVKESLKFRDMQGNLLYKLDEKVLRIRESFDILKPDGQLAAKVHNAIIDPLREQVHDRDPRW